MMSGMGYTTEFEGKFSLSAPAPAEVVLAIRDLDGRKGKLPPGTTPWPDGYCQWVLTADLTGIEWDGEEKFYDYVEWLQAIIDNVLKPAGVALTGTVKYQGESFDDAGTLSVVDGEVVTKETGVEIADLRAFKDFAIREYGEEIVEAYRRRGGK